MNLDPNFQMKKLLFLIILLVCLTSCHSKPELRKDIKDFISQFSLEASLNEYKKGGYTSTKVETEQGKETKTVISLEYSRVDENHPTYVEVTTISENDVVTSNVEVRFVEIEGQYYLSTNGELKSSSLKEVNNLITQFFYKKTELDGQYHTQGYYYGDYLKEVAPALQRYVTIDQANKLYKMEYTVEKSDYTMSQNYSVNKFGMLVENHNTIANDEKAVVQDIYVHN